MKNLFLLVLTVLFVTPVFSQHRLTNREVFDFNTGDIIHKKSYALGVPPVYNKRLVIDKRLSLDKDTIFYTFLDSIYTLDPNIKPFQWQLSTKTQTQMITNLEAYPLYNKYGKEDLGPVDTSYFLSNGRIVNFQEDESYSPEWFKTWKVTYIQGLGKFTYFEEKGGGNATLNYDELVYYKKSGEEYGERIPHLSTDKKPIAHQIKTYPNPADNAIHVQGISEGNYQIANAMGQIMQNGKLTDQSIDISLLEKGVYTIRVTNEANTYFGRFIKTDNSQ